MLKKNEEIVKKYELDCNSRNFSGGSIHTYSMKVRAFIAWLELQNIEIMAVDNGVMQSYADHLRAKRNKHNTIRNVFAAINNLYEFLIYKNLMSGDNPVPPVMKRYIRSFKGGDSSRPRSISVQEASNLVDSILNSEDKALITLLFKTGVRANEALSIELNDINWSDQSIRLKPHPKRTNLIVFFDEETKIVLQRWLRSRSTWNTNSNALFINRGGNGPLKIDALERRFKKYTRSVGLDNPNSDRVEDHLTPHATRHWFSTHLRLNGMPREFVQELRGDKGKDAIDLYIHINKKELRENYLRYIPQLGLEV